MSKIGLIIQREYSTRVKKKAFIVLTLVVPILVVGLMFLATWLSMKETKHYKVLVSDPRNICQGWIHVGQDEVPPATFDFYPAMLYLEDFETGEDYQDYDVFVALDPDVITNKTINAAYREKPSNSAQIYIQNRLSTRLEEYFAMDRGIDLETFHEIKQPIKFSFTSIENDEEAKLRDQRQGVGLIFSIFIFIFIMVYSAQVMRGVIEEKTSRVVEIIVSSVKPFQLMMGKVIAVGLVGLTQFLIWIVLIFILVFAAQLFILPDVMDPSNMAAVQGQMGPMNELNAVDNEVIDLVFHQINWSVLITLFLIYFIGGYLLYGSLFAMIGSAVDSETDTQQLMFPVMMPLFFSYIVSVMIQGNSDGPAAVWFSQIPFSSPIIMLQRVAAGTVTIWEVGLSLLLLVATFIFTTYLAGKIYRVGILMYGKKASWKEIFKWMRH